MFDIPFTNPQPVTDSFDGTIGLVGVCSCYMLPATVDLSDYDSISIDPTVITDPSFCVDPIPYDLFPIDISIDPPVIIDPYFVVDPIPGELFPIDVTLDSSETDAISIDPTVITDPSFCVDPIPYDLFPIDISIDPTVIIDPYFVVDPIPYDLFPIDLTLDSSETDSKSIDPDVITDPYFVIDPIQCELFPIDLTLDSFEIDSTATDSSLFIRSVVYDSIALGLTFDPSLTIAPIAFFRTTTDITITSSTEIPVFPDETIINPLASTSLFTLLNITDPSEGYTPSNQGVLITQSDDATFTSINKSVLAKTKRLV